MKSIISTALIAVAYIAVCGAIILGFNAVTNNTSCTKSEIYYERQEVSNSELLFSESYISQNGANGIKEVCKRGSEVVSETVLSPQVDEVYQVGTKETPAIIPTNTYNARERVGAWCYDGSYSSATGRGACSWHDGVEEWVYE